MVLVHVVMLNMLLAVIMDVYTEVKGGIGRAETLWSQTVEILRRMSAERSGRRIALEEVLRQLDPQYLNTGVGRRSQAPVYASTILDTVHNLSAEQATEILE